MELDTFNRKFSMPNAHYLIVIDSLSSQIKALRQALSFRDKRMVSRGLERALYSAQDPFAVVSDRAGLAVSESPCSNYPATERVNNPLMSQADA